jgi:hypothetical protein
VDGLFPFWPLQYQHFVVPPLVLLPFIGPASGAPVGLFVELSFLSMVVDERSHYVLSQCVGRHNVEELLCCSWALVP